MKTLDILYMIRPCLVVIKIPHTKHVLSSLDSLWTLWYTVQAFLFFNLLWWKLRAAVDTYIFSSCVLKILLRLSLTFFQFQQSPPASQHKQPKLSSHSSVCTYGDANFRQFPYLIVGLVINEYSVNYILYMMEVFIVTYYNCYSNLL